MAIGMGKMFGFSIRENFLFPYTAASIREFWRKWHISLSTWFREYLYFPLGGSRRGRARAAMNRLLVFFCTGLWHGANWTFVLWGLGHGLLSSLEGSGVIPVQRLQKSGIGRLLCRVYTLLAVMLLFVIFRADSISEAFRVIGSMFSFSAAPSGWYEFASLLPAASCLILIIGMLFSGGFAPEIRKLSAELENSSKAAYYAGCIFSLILFAICLMAMSRGGFSPFIYTQF